VEQAQTPNTADAASSLIGLILTSDNAFGPEIIARLATVVELEAAELKRMPR